MRYIIFSLLVVTLLLVTACGNQVEKLPPEPKTIPSVDDGSGAAGTASPEVVAAVDEGLQEADQLDAELNNDELDKAIDDIDLSDW